MRLLAIVLVCGCASARSQEQSGVDSNTQQSDASRVDSSMQMIDGSVGPTPITLTQTTSQAIKAGNTIACPGTTANTTATNNWYRVFDLAAMGVTGTFTVTKVSFQVEHCKPLSGTACANLAVRVGTYAATPGATLALMNMTILASNATVPVPTVIETGGTTPMTPGGTVDAPISATIPANAKLLVEVDAPNLGNYAFYMGSNDGGETSFGYVMAADCNVTVPTNISGVFGTTPAAARNLLLTVTGVPN